jgi:hypothetical protein
MFAPLINFCHAKPLGYVLRSHVAVSYYGADFLGLKDIACKVFARQRGFGCIAIVPLILVQEISNLQHLSVFPLLHRQPDLPDEFA